MENGIVELSETETEIGKSSNEKDATIADQGIEEEKVQGILEGHPNNPTDAVEEPKEHLDGAINSLGAENENDVSKDTAYGEDGTEATLDVEDNKPEPAPADEHSTKEETVADEKETEENRPDQSTYVATESGETATVVEGTTPETAPADEHITEESILAEIETEKNRSDQRFYVATESGETATVGEDTEPERVLADEEVSKDKDKSVVDEIDHKTNDSVVNERTHAMESSGKAEVVEDKALDPVQVDEQVSNEEQDEIAYEKGLCDASDSLEDQVVGLATTEDDLPKEDTPAAPDTVVDKDVKSTPAEGFLIEENAANDETDLADATALEDGTLLCTAPDEELSKEVSVADERAFPAEYAVANHAVKDGEMELTTGDEEALKKETSADETFPPSESGDASPVMEHEFVGANATEEELSKLVSVADDICPPVDSTGATAAVQDQEMECMVADVDTKEKSLSDQTDFPSNLEEVVGTTATDEEVSKDLGAAAVPLDDEELEPAADDGEVIKDENGALQIESLSRLDNVFAITNGEVVRPAAIEEKVSEFLNLTDDKDSPVNTVPPEDKMVVPAAADEEGIAREIASSSELADVSTIVDGELGGTTATVEPTSKEMNVADDTASPKVATVVEDGRLEPAADNEDSKEDNVADQMTFPSEGTDASAILDNDLVGATASEQEELAEENMVGKIAPPEDSAVAHGWIGEEEVEPAAGHGEDLKGENFAEQIESPAEMHDESESAVPTAGKEEMSKDANEADDGTSAVDPDLVTVSLLDGEIKQIRADEQDCEQESVADEITSPSKVADHVGATAREKEASTDGSIVNEIASQADSAVATGCVGEEQVEPPAGDGEDLEGDSNGKQMLSPPDLHDVPAILKVESVEPMATEEELFKEANGADDRTSPADSALAAVLMVNEELKHTKTDEEDFKDDSAADESIPLDDISAVLQDNLLGAMSSEHEVSKEENMVDKTASSADSAVATGSVGEQEVEPAAGDGVNLEGEGLDEQMESPSELHKAPAVLEVESVKSIATEEELSKNAIVTDSAFAAVSLLDEEVEHTIADDEDLKQDSVADEMISPLKVADASTILENGLVEATGRKQVANRGKNMVDALVSTVDYSVATGCDGEEEVKLASDDGEDLSIAEWMESSPELHDVPAILKVEAVGLTGEQVSKDVIEADESASSADSVLATVPLVDEEVEHTTADEEFEEGTANGTAASLKLADAPTKMVDEVVEATGAEEEVSKEVSMADDGAPQTESAETHQTDSAEAPQTDSAEAPQVDSAEAPQIDSAERHQIDSAESCQIFSAEAPHTDSAEVPRTYSAAASVSSTVDEQDSKEDNVAEEIASLSELADASAVMEDDIVQTMADEEEVSVADDVAPQAVPPGGTVPVDEANFKEEIVENEMAVSSELADAPPIMEDNLGGATSMKGKMFNEVSEADDIASQADVAEATAPVKDAVETDTVDGEVFREKSVVGIASSLEFTGATQAERFEPARTENRSSEETSAADEIASRADPTAASVLVEDGEVEPAAVNEEDSKIENIVCEVASLSGFDDASASFSVSEDQEMKLAPKDEQVLKEDSVGHEIGYPEALAEASATLEDEVVEPSATEEDPREEERVPSGTAFSACSVGVPNSIVSEDVELAPAYEVLKEKGIPDDIACSVQSSDIQEEASDIQEQASEPAEIDEKLSPAAVDPVAVNEEVSKVETVSDDVASPSEFADASSTAEAEASGTSPANLLKELSVPDEMSSPKHFALASVVYEEEMKPALADEHASEKNVDYEIAHSTESCIAADTVEPASAGEVLKGQSDSKALSFLAEMADAPTCQAEVVGRDAMEDVSVALGAEEVESPARNGEHFKDECGEHEIMSPLESADASDTAQDDVVGITATEQEEPFQADASDTVEDEFVGSTATENELSRADALRTLEDDIVETTATDEDLSKDVSMTRQVDLPADSAVLNAQVENENVEHLAFDDEYPKEQTAADYSSPGLLVEHEDVRTTVEEELSKEVSLADEVRSPEEYAVAMHIRKGMDVYRPTAYEEVFKEQNLVDEVPSTEDDRLSEEENAVDEVPSSNESFDSSDPVQDEGVESIDERLSKKAIAADDIAESPVATAVMENSDIEHGSDNASTIAESEVVEPSTVEEQFLEYESVVDEIASADSTFATAIVNEKDVGSAPAGRVSKQESLRNSGDFVDEFAVENELVMPFGIVDNLKDSVADKVASSVDSPVAGAVGDKDVEVAPPDEVSKKERDGEEMVSQSGSANVSPFVENGLVGNMAAEEGLLKEVVMADEIVYPAYYLVHGAVKGVNEVEAGPPDEKIPKEESVAHEMASSAASAEEELSKENVADEMASPADFKVTPAMDAEEMDHSAANEDSNEESNAGDRGSKVELASLSAVVTIDDVAQVLDEVITDASFANETASLAVLKNSDVIVSGGDLELVSGKGEVSDDNVGRPCRKKFDEVLAILEDEDLNPSADGIAKEQPADSRHSLLLPVSEDASQGALEVLHKEPCLGDDKFFEQSKVNERELASSVDVGDGEHAETRKELSEATAAVKDKVVKRLLGEREIKEEIVLGEVGDARESPEVTLIVGVNDGGPVTTNKESSKEASLAVLETFAKDIRDNGLGLATARFLMQEKVVAEEKGSSEVVSGLDNAERDPILIKKLLVVKEGTNATESMGIPQSSKELAGIVAPHKGQEGHAVHLASHHSFEAIGVLTSGLEDIKVNLSSDAPNRQSEGQVASQELLDDENYVPLSTHAIDQSSSHAIDQSSSWISVSPIEFGDAGSKAGDSLASIPYKSQSSQSVDELAPVGGDWRIVSQHDISQLAGSSLPTRSRDEDLDSRSTGTRFPFSLVLWCSQSLSSLFGSSK